MERKQEASLRWGEGASHFTKQAPQMMILAEARHVPDPNAPLGWNMTPHELSGAGAV